MSFASGNRVEHVDLNHKGTIIYDNGDNVQVKWDDGKIGNLSYDKTVWFNAYRLQKLASKITNK